MFPSTTLSIEGKFIANLLIETVPQQTPGINILIRGESFTVLPTATPTPTPTRTLTPTPAPSPTRTTTPLPPPDAGIVSMAQPDQTVPYGSDVRAILQANTGYQILAAYGINITYNPAVPAVNTSIGTSGVEPGANGFLNAVNSTTPGLIRTSGFNIDGRGPGTALELLIVNWTAINPGYSDIGITVNNLTDLQYNNVGTPREFMVLQQERMALYRQ